ncbi:LuxR C-terminal-related transcriptional regulator [Taklimakanibacter lacteus]|uniref:LuxR C-terminal-related transcriptional regulator n=1 Tax=Taklimakanibacter lacteus TaxID=2268456 RepID=UPI0013C48642
MSALTRAMTRRQMSLMFIETKMHPPHLRGAMVERPRLIAMLEAATAAKLATVSSPAGFGKSTLLSQWGAKVAAKGGRVAWLSLDAQDNDLARFLKYVTATLNRADPSIAANALALIESSPVTPVDSILGGLINDLARAGDPVYLVLDDAHLIVSPEIALFLNSMVAYAPPALHIVLATRGELPVELIAMRMKGHAVNLGDSELRFSLDETDHYLRAICRLDLPMSAIVALHHKTEGWPAGLQLVALALAHEDSRETFIADFSGSQRDVADFLSHEVLARQPEAVQDFLLRTSILERFNLGLVEAVCPEHDCPATLGLIERANLFLIALDSTGQWFRYHHLFSDFLRGKVERWPAEKRAALHRRASSWLSANGSISDAVGHALAAGDKDLAARLVEECALPIIMQGHMPMVTEWLNRLPPELIAMRPRLLLTRVWAHFHMGRSRDAVRDLRRAKLLVVRQAGQGRIDAATTRSLQAELQTLTAGVISAADWPRMATRLAARWLADYPESEPFARGTLCNIRSFAHFSLGELDASRLSALKGRDHHTLANSIFGIVYSDLLLGLVELAAGNLHQAHDLLARAMRLSRVGLGANSYSEAMSAIIQVELLYEWNDLHNAERLLHQHRGVIEECGLVVHEMACKLHLARLAAAQGRHDEAIIYLERAEQLGIEKRYRRLTASALNDRVRLLLSRGDVAAARMALQLRGITTAMSERAEHVHPLDEYAHIGAARLLIAEGQPKRAIVVLERIAERQRKDERLRALLQVRALVAIAAHAAGETLQALAATVDLMALAVPQNAVRSLVDEGQPLKAALDFARGRIPAWSRSSETAVFVDRILAELGRGGSERIRPMAGTPLAGKRQLSSKEMEVASYLVRAYSNRELARSLSMAPDTVKWHLKNIFGKLGVSNRTEAALKLREIGLSDFDATMR